MELHQSSFMLCQLLQQVKYRLICIILQVPCLILKPDSKHICLESHSGLILWMLIRLIQLLFQRILANPRLKRLLLVK